jgi:hypothetical protein
MRIKIGRWILDRGTGQFYAHKAALTSLGDETVEAPVVGFGGAFMRIKLVALSLQVALP